MRFAIALLLVAAASGQTSQERGKQIVMQALDALGGNNYLAMRDRTETGRVYSFGRQGLSGLAKATIYTFYPQPDNPPEAGKVYIQERESFGKDKDHEDYAFLFHENNAWEITFRGARPIPRETIERYQESTRRGIFYILRQRLEEPGLIFESRGTDNIDNHPAEVVDITDANNDVTTVYFSMSDKLPMKQVFYRRDPDTRERHEEISRFSKYLDAGAGVLWPFNVSRFRDGEKIFEIYAETVSVNQDLPTNLFALPGDMKMLPPAR